MSKRLQVILADEEMRQLRRQADQNRVTVAEWVRQALRAASRRQPATGSARKLATVGAAVRHQFPTANIDQMLGEIESGYLPETR